MSVPADGQLAGLYYLPSHQEAATSEAWVQPLLGGDKTQQNLNPPVKGRRSCRSRKGEVEGGNEKTKDKVFEAGRRGNWKNEIQNEIQS